MLITPTAAGDLRNKITVITVGPGPLNELGETSPVSTPIATTWAKLTPVSGTERYVNAQNTGNVTHEIRTRYVPYIDHTCKLTLGKRTFDIVSVLDLENQHIELVILVQEVIK